jgi:hypothetical protein
MLLAALAGCSSSTPPAQPKSASPMPVRITSFYASRPNPPGGEKTLVCYGVENALEVRLDPPVDRVWPAAARCFDFVPSKETKLTLTAIRGAEQVSQSLTIAPGPPAVKLLQVTINKVDVAKGELVTLCYKAKNAANVEVEPGAWIDPHTAVAGCVSDYPQRTTTYTVTATGAGGDTDTERVTAKVK